MKDLEVERTLRQWAKDLVSRYTWLTIRFEYNERREAYLVSYYPEWKIEEDEDFVIESGAFEDRMNEQYDEFRAPLFCYEEKLFKLSPHAEVIRHSNPEVVRSNKPEPVSMRHMTRKPKRPRPIEVEEPMEV